MTFQRATATALLALLAVVLSFARPLAAQGTASLAVPGEIVLKAPAGTTAAQVQAMADAAGCRVVGPIVFSPDYYLLELKTRAARPVGRTRAVAATPPAADVEAAVAKLAAIPGALASENGISRKLQTTTNPTFTPNDEFYTQQWDMRMIRLPEAWAVQVGAQAVRAAVIDTGLDIAHPEFTRPNGTPNYILPQNVSTGTAAGTDVTDVDGHGTHVSGTVAAVGNNTVGIAGVGGLTLGGVDIRIMPIKASQQFTDDNGNTDTGFTFAAEIAGINYAAQQGAGVINMSLGGYRFSAPVAAAIAAAQQQGVIIVAATGNDAVNNSIRPGYPAGYPGVIAVSAVGPDRTLASYSNFGGNVTIAAPGGDSFDGPPATSMILSSVPISNALTDPGIDPDDDGYDYFQGTSMATPHVTGVVALLLAAGAPPGEIRSAIQTTAQQLDEVPNFSGGNQYGAGLIDAYAALVPYTGPRVRILSPADQTVTLLRSIDIVLQVRNVQQLRDDPDATLTVTIRTATTPSVVLRTINVNKSSVPLPPTGSSAATPVTVTLPGISLPPDRYVIEARLSNVIRDNADVKFLTVTTRAQPAGRALFSVPFVVPDAAGGPEAALFGNTSFVLQRWNPFADNGQGGYARFSSAGTPQESAARFRITQFDLNASLPADPLSYDATLAAGARPSLAPIGLGYWLDLAADATLNPSGPTTSNPVAIELFTEGGGWNQIGAPFTFPVDWNVVSVLYQGRILSLQQAVNENVIKSSLVGYANGDYVFSIAPLGQLVPFQGYWVKAQQRCTLVVPPTPTSEQSVTRAAALPGGSSAGGWRVRIGASVAGDRDGHNYFGQAPGAEGGEDRLDVLKPPSGAGHAYVRFLPKNASRRAGAYAYDLRPAGSAREEWTLAVTTDRANAEVILSWDGLSGAPRRTRFLLKDSQTGQAVALRSRSSHRYRSGEAGETRLFSLIAEPEASSGALVIRDLRVSANGGAGGGRAAAGLSVRFLVNREAEVFGVVKTLSGRTVARLTGSGRAAATGQTTLRWDGRGSEGGALPAGPYVVEITARGDDGQSARAGRPVMIVR